MNKDELLYRYFSNSLSKAEEKEFYNLLEIDAEFKRQFDFETDVKRVSKAYNYNKLKAKLTSFEVNLDSETKNVSYNSYLKIAASILVLLSVGWFGYKSMFGLDYEVIYQDSYNTYPNTVFKITRSDTINSTEREAFFAYESENYQLALNKFKELPDKNYLNFYKAQSYINLNNNFEAKQLFKSIIKNNQKFTAESHWYLALIFIKEKDKINSVLYLNNLVRNFDYKNEEAKALLKQLR